MSSQNIEIVRRLLERWSNDDLEGFIEGVDPELEWRTSGIYPDVDPIYHGHDGFRKFWRSRTTRAGTRRWTPWSPTVRGLVPMRRRRHPTNGRMGRVLQRRVR